MTDEPTTPTRRYGLIGRTLGHSWSPLIHARLGSTPYELFGLEPEELEGFVREGRWDGVNVTIPYKTDVLAFADELSDVARRIGAANVLVRRADGSILADNTDAFGFSWLLERFLRRSYGKPAAELLAGSEPLVLGSGGASKAICAALGTLGATPVVVSRNPMPGDISYDEVSTRFDATLIVNATPVGMFPNCPASPLPPGTLDSMLGLLGVIDVVYNPRRTGLCLEAARLGIPSESGLAMLVAQAKRSSELFRGVALDDGLIEDIEREIRSTTDNVVLIGMPGSGKTSAGRKLAHLLGRPFVDTDDAIELETGSSPSQIIMRDGEDSFRRVETGMLAEYGKRSGVIIACGGGVVTRPENRALISQNSSVVMLDRPIAELSTTGRPLSASMGVDRLASERMGLYREWADVIVTCQGSPSADAREIRGVLGL